MRKILLAIFTMLCGTLCAQTIDEIKESGQFLYGLSDNRNEAEDQVFMALSDYMEQESECDTTNWEGKLHDMQDGDKILVYLIKKDLFSVAEMPEIVIPQSDIVCDDQIVQRVVEAGDYFRLKEYLETRKNNFHDILFEGVRSGFPNNENCYWVIFDDKGKIIVVVDKSGSKDLLTGQFIKLSDYQNNKKMWLQIY